MVDNIKNRIKHFITENFLFTTNIDSISDDLSFMESGIVDSTGILEIVNYIEKEFGVQLEDYEIIPENLGSINQLTIFISGKIVVANK